MRTLRWQRLARRGSWGDQHQGGPLLPLQAEQQLHDHFTRFLVEVAGWFIGKDQGRISNKGPCQGNPLLFST